MESSSPHGRETATTQLQQLLSWKKLGPVLINPPGFQEEVEILNSDF